MSNAQTMANVFAPIDAYNREVISQNTWGHLAPIKNKTYKGTILFSKSEYCSGSITLIATKFQELDSSPWFYDSVYDYLRSLPLQEGTVYTLAATFRNYRWWGTPNKIYSLI